MKDSETIFLKFFSVGDIANLCKMLLLLSDKTRMFFHDLEVFDLKSFIKTYLMIFIRLMFNSVTYKTIGRYFVGIIALNHFNEIVGFVYLNIKSHGFSKSATYGIVVRDDYQSKGIGKALTSHILNYAKACQLSRMSLITSTDNTRAIVLYDKFGFVIEGLRKRGDVWRKNVFDVYYMVLHLQPLSSRVNGKVKEDLQNITTYVINVNLMSLT